MKQRSLNLFTISILIIISSIVCSTGAQPGSQIDEELAATLVAVRLTQTALASVPETSATPPPPSAEPLATPVNPAQFGSLSGNLSFPSEGIPALTVVAFAVNSSTYFYISTTPNQPDYRFENLPPGLYQVVAYTQDGNIAGGYTQAVLCGLTASCTDHSLVAVEVIAGQEAANINPGDWYAPANTYPPNPLAPTPALGSISGKLSYPSEFIPPLRVVAFNIQTGQYYFVDTALNQTSYTISGLPAGVYHVVAYMKEYNLSGGYTKAVSCGLTVECKDHSLVDIQLSPGQQVTGIDPADWYAEQGLFPPDPTQ